MWNGDDLLPALISGGFGAGVTGVIVASIQMWSGRSESRAHAADLVASAAGRMVERLDTDNTQLREAVLLLTDVIEEVLPQLDADPKVLKKLSLAKRVAQRAV